MRALPNLLTAGRLALSLAVLLLLLAAAGAPPFSQAQALHALALRSWAFAAFAVAAITDFFDGWLARRWNVVSLLGAVLDPIADKVLVAGAVIGLVAAGDAAAALPGGLILFREFAVSALRETLAPKGLRLPVTLLAKWKTTVQLIALAAMIEAPALVAGLSYASEHARTVVFETATKLSLWLLWLAAAITVWTGVEYGLAARRALAAQRPRAEA